MFISVDVEILVVVWLVLASALQQTTGSLLEVLPVTPVTLLANGQTFEGWQ